MIVDKSVVVTGLPTGTIEGVRIDVDTTIPGVIVETRGIEDTTGVRAGTTGRTDAVPEVQNEISNDDAMIVTELIHMKIFAFMSGKAV